MSADTQFHEALSLEQASEMMTRFGAEARLLAGGTDLLVDVRKGRLRPGHLVSLNRLDELKGVTAAAGGLRIGALTTVTQLIESPLVRSRAPAILDAALKMAGPQIRNMATVGGNLCNAFRCADLPPILLALNAVVALWSRAGRRTMPLAGFFLGPQQTERRSDEVLTEVFVPDPPAHFGAAFARFSLRESNAIAVAGVAAALSFAADGTVGAARIALSAAAPTPLLVPEAAATLIGHALDDDHLGQAAAAAMAACHAVTDIRGQADFRQALVGSLTRTALGRAAERAAAHHQARIAQ